MPRISEPALREVELALKQYCAQVERAPLQLTTKHTYTLHAHNFVKWLDGRFEPGSKVPAKR